MLTAPGFALIRKLFCFVKMPANGAFIQFLPFDAYRSNHKSVSYRILRDILKLFVRTLTLDMAMANDARIGFTIPTAARGMRTIL